MKKLIYIFGFISVGLVFAKDSPSDCAKIESNASRLACYDKFFKREKPNQNKKIYSSKEDDLKKNYLINRNKEKLIVNNGNKKNNEIESSFGLTYSQIKENNKSEETKIIASSITKATKQITRKFTYRLMNNHIWQSVSPVPPNKISYFKKGTKIELKESRMGSFWMVNQSNDMKIKVKRIN
jgi:hypothetical protein